MSMPAQNLFYDFASVASTDNILNDEQYAADADRLQGNVPGIARQQLVNKALKQAAAIASSIGQVAAITMDDVIGDSEEGLENLVAFLENGFLPKVSSSSAGKYLRVNAQGTSREWVPLPVASTTLAGIVSIGNQSFSGLKTFTGGIAGSLTGNVTGNLTGNAASATKLQTARTINGVSFDGTSNIFVGLKAQYTDDTFDFDEYTTAGMWYISSNAKILNGPPNMINGYVNIVDVTSSGPVAQIAFWSSVNMWFRMKAYSTSNWSDWQKMLVDDDIANLLPKTGGTMTGTINSMDIVPKTNNTYSLGSSSYKWSNVYATTFTGNVTGNVSGSSGSCTGNAATATKLATARSIGLSGIVANAVSFDGSANVTLAVTAVPASLLTGTISTARLPASSTSASGIVRLATNAEANTGTATNIAITPAALAYYIQQNVPSTVNASETAKGVIEIATQAETNAGTDNTKAITPAKLASYVTTKANKVRVYVNNETDSQIIADSNPGDIIIRAVSISIT